MAEILRKVFEFAGMAGLGVAIPLSLAYAIATIDHRVKVMRRRHELRHRFDRPPQAKCYCKDCSHRSGAGLCDTLDRYVEQQFFCEKADPDPYDVEV